MTGNCTHPIDTYTTRAHTEGMTETEGAEGMEITVSGSRVEVNGRMVGKIEWPYEEAQKRVRRSTYKVIMGGRAVGNFRTLEDAIEAATAWTPADDIEREIYERCTR